MHRRHFLQALGNATLAACVPRVWAAQPAVPDAPRFILIFLRGGYDAANLLVPHASDFYYEARPNIAVPRPGEGNEASIALDASWALHPALRQSLLPLWQRRELAFVPFAGTRDLSRSHFETQDHIELGQGTTVRDYNDGFLNRMVVQLGGRARPIALTAQLPLSLRGQARVANVAPGLDRRSPALPQRQQALLESMWAGTTLGASVREGFAVREVATHDMEAAENGADGSRFAAEMVAASRGAAYPRTFVAHAQHLGVLVRDHFNVGFIDVGGWDTHVAEAAGNGTQGILANRLNELGQGLVALAQALGPAWPRTVVMVISEFGRTFRENGNRGTDHGHGTVYWVMGGAIRGGRVAGDQVEVRESALNQNRDYPVLTDYRDLLGGLFGRLWGLSPRRIEAVFPGSRPLDLQLA